MTLRRPRHSTPSTSRAVRAEFSASTPPAVDGALSALLARGRARARADSARAARARQVAALEMLTGLRFVAGGRPAGAAWVLGLVGVVVPLLLLELAREDVEQVRRIADSVRSVL